MKGWLQTIAAVGVLILTCGGMLVYVTLWITSTISTTADAQRAAITAVADANRSSIAALTQSLQQSELKVGERLTKVEVKDQYYDAQLLQIATSMDRVTVAVSELTKELSNVEGVLSDGKRK